MEKRNRIISTMGVADSISEVSIKEALPKDEGLLIENKELKDKLAFLKKLISIIAHDVRLPISSAVAFSQLAKEKSQNENASGLEDESISNLLDYAYEGNKTSLDLLDNLLQWTRLQQNGVKIETMTINLSNQVEQAIVPLLPIAQRKSINLKNEIANDINVSADSQMLQTVIRNLSSNAIKFTQSGGYISISSEKKDNKVEIHVTDNGVGIPKEKQNKILNNLGNTTSGTDGEKGTGLGLSICEEMVHKMGGHIDVKSEEGGGTTFTITLPAGSK